MTRLVITGAAGMTGSELARQSAKRGWDSVPLTRQELDITDGPAVREIIASSSPDVVINAAAYTAVDEAERNPGEAMRINRDGAANVARAAADVGAAIIHISSDYVFDGDGSRPYLPDDPVHPINAYGESKLAGEKEVRGGNPVSFIVRTSWVYSHDGRNFMRTIVRRAKEGKALRVVNDQLGSPTSAADLAGALLTVASALPASAARAGTYHFCNSGSVTWYDFARAIFEEAGLSPVIEPVPTSEYSTPARRPRYSVLDTRSFTRAFGVTPRPWREAMRATLERLQ